MRPPRMGRLLLIGATALLLVAAMALSAGAATPWQDAELVVDIYYDQGDPYGPFEATGPAVVSGLICAEGDTVDIFSEDQHRNDDGVTRFTVIKQFECADGSGTFDVRSNIINNQIVGFELVFWSVVGGTGDYEDLRGDGTAVGEGTPNPDMSIETFTGRFR